MVIELNQHGIARDKLKNASGFSLSQTLLNVNYTYF